MLPQAREESLAVEELSGETLVYDLERDRVHCLNRTTSLVWRQCDGRTSVTEMAARVGDALNVPADESLIWLALQRLERAQLLAGGARRPADVPRYTRREVARRLGLAGGMSVLLPLVTSVTAPTPAQAQSAISAQPSQAPRTQSPSSTQAPQESGEPQVSEEVTTRPSGNSQLPQRPTGHSPSGVQTHSSPTHLPGDTGGSESIGGIGGNSDGDGPEGPNGSLFPHRRPNLGLWRIGRADR